MTMFVRSKHSGNRVAYEYFEVAKARWVACEAALLKFFLDRGDCIHSNPRFDPTLYILSEAHNAKSK